MVTWVGVHKSVSGADVQINCTTREEGRKVAALMQSIARCGDGAVTLRFATEFKSSAGTHAQTWAVSDLNAAKALAGAVVAIADALMVLE